MGTGKERVAQVMTQMVKSVDGAVQKQQDIAAAELGRYVDEARESRKVIAELRGKLAAAAAPFSQKDFLRYQKEARESRKTIAELKAKLADQKVGRNGCAEACNGCAEAAAGEGFLFTEEEAESIVDLVDAALTAVKTARERGSLAAFSSKFERLEKLANEVDVLF